MKKIKDLPIGSKIKFGKYQVESETPQPIIFIKADDNHYKDGDNPSIVDHVTLIAEKIIDLRAFDAIEPNNSDSSRKQYGNNRYSYSNQRQWLNSNQLNWFNKTHNVDEPPTNSGTGDYNTPYDTKAGFLNLFTTEEISNIVPTNLKVAKHSVDGGGREIVNDKVFLLSETEVGLGNENGIVEGKVFSIFSDNASRCINLTEQCFNNTKSTNKPSSQSSNWYWWLRTPYSSFSYNVWNVNSDGSLDYFSARSGDVGVRPALNLNAEVQVSDNLDSEGCYTLVYNQAPEISGSDGDLGSKTEGFAFLYSVNDKDTTDTLTITEKLDNIVINTINNAVRNQEYTIDLVPKFDELDLSQHTIKIEVTDGKSTTTRTHTFTKINTAPVISGTDENLGDVYQDFVKEYTIIDAENDNMTVVLKVNGVVKKTLENQPSGTTIKLGLNEYWSELAYDSTHTYLFEVSDKYHTTTRTFTFTKKDNRILCITKPIETSREVRKLTLSSVLKLGEFDTLTIYACNNGFDESPTWEECTNEYINKLPFFFKNKIKVNDKWGLSVKFDMRKHLSKTN